MSLTRRGRVVIALFVWLAINLPLAIVTDNGGVIAAVGGSTLFLAITWVRGQLHRRRPDDPPPRGLRDIVQPTPRGAPPEA